jgi:dihydrofolate reductase
MKVTVLNALSANGFIAEQDGSTPWQDAEWDLFEHTMNEYDCIAVGRKTFDEVTVDGDLDNYKGEVFVLSSNNARFNSPKAIFDEAAAKEYKNILIIGGKGCNTAFFKEKLVTNIIIDFEPKIFSQGIPFIDDNDEFFVDLELLSYSTYGNSGIRCEYNVKKYI